MNSRGGGGSFGYENPGPRAGRVKQAENTGRVKQVNCGTGFRACVLFWGRKSGPSGWPGQAGSALGRSVFVRCACVFHCDQISAEGAEARVFKLFPSLLRPRPGQEYFFCFPRSRVASPAPSAAPLWCPQCLDPRLPSINMLNTSPSINNGLRAGFRRSFNNHDCLGTASQVTPPACKRIRR